MPRRKKRSTLHDKAPLIFTESPLNKQNNPPAPVYCAEHPQTAVSVPVENYSDLSWVSPQFDQVALTVKRKARASRRRPNPLGNTNLTRGCTCSHVHKENALDRNHKPSKYKPLKFQGENLLPQTVIEDVDITTDDEENYDVVTNLSYAVKISPVLRRKISRRKSNSNLKQKSHLSSPEQFEDVDVSVKTPVDDNHLYVSHSLRETTPISKNLESPVKILFPETVNARISGTNNMKKSLNLSSDFSKQGHIRKRANPTSVENLGLNTTFNHTPVPNRKKPKILVSDTPEAEYNVPVRIRKLRNRLINL